MKKILAMVAALVVMGGVACAGDFYNGDFQIQLGYALNKGTMEDFPKDVTAKEFDFSLETYHFFRPIEMLGVGFVGGFNVGVGTTDNWKVLGTSDAKYEDGLSASLNFELGPAVALYLGNVVRFGFNVCYDSGWNYETPVNFKYDGYYMELTGHEDYQVSYSGIALGLQAKFVPESKVNPVIGWRLVKGTASSMEVISNVPDPVTGDTSYNTDTIHRKYDFTQNVFYAAISFSW